MVQRLFACLLFITALALAAPLIAADEPAAASREFFGTVTARTGATVRLRLETHPGPPAGTVVDLSAFFRKAIMGMQTTGWLLAAKARVHHTAGDAMTLVIVEEKSVMTVNGKKVDHLPAGTRVKIVVP